MIDLSKKLGNSAGCSTVGSPRATSNEKRYIQQSFGCTHGAFSATLPHQRVFDDACGALVAVADIPGGRSGCPVSCQIKYLDFSVAGAVGCISSPLY